MSKAEMLRQSAEASNERRIAGLKGNVETLLAAKLQSAEDLNALLKPLAQSLATLSVDAGQVLIEIDSTTRKTQVDFEGALERASSSLNEATQKSEQAAAGLKKAARGLSRRHYALATAVGLGSGVISALLVIGIWAWRQPPSVAPTVDVKALAEALKPALVPALTSALTPAGRPSRGK